MRQRVGKRRNDAALRRAFMAPRYQFLVAALAHGAGVDGEVDIRGIMFASLGG